MINDACYCMLKQYDAPSSVFQLIGVNLHVTGFYVFCANPSYKADDFMITSLHHHSSSAAVQSEFNCVKMLRAVTQQEP